MLKKGTAMTEGKRVRTSQRIDEPTPPNIFADLDWARANRDRLEAQYGGEEQRVLLIYRQEVVGQGESITEAERDAEARLAPNAAVITPITFFVGGYDPLIRIAPAVRAHQEQ